MRWPNDRHPQRGVTVTDRIVDDRWRRAHEAYLRYSGFALAAFQAAHSPTTPRGLVRELLERHARFMLRAEEARKLAKEYEP